MVHASGATGRRTTMTAPWLPSAGHTTAGGMTVCSRRRAMGAGARLIPGMVLTGTRRARTGCGTGIESWRGSATGRGIESVRSSIAATTPSFRMRRCGPAGIDRGAGGEGSVGTWMMSGGGRRVSRGGGREYGVVLVLMLEGGEARLRRMWFVGQTQRPPANATRRGRRGEASYWVRVLTDALNSFQRWFPLFWLPRGPTSQVIRFHFSPSVPKRHQTRPDHHHHTVQPGLDLALAPEGFASPTYAKHGLSDSWFLIVGVALVRSSELRPSKWTQPRTRPRTRSAHDQGKGPLLSLVHFFKPRRRLTPPL
jgi:hypothetical protein